MYKDNGGPEILEKLKETGKEAIEGVKTFIHDVTVKVDMNSGTPEMAEMLVGEFQRNPKARAELASLVSHSSKNFT